MECYAQTISVSLSLKLKPVNAKVDIYIFYICGLICGLYTVPVGGGGGGPKRGVWLEMCR